jgi:hypothetical protein
MEQIQFCEVCGRKINIIKESRQDDSVFVGSGFIWAEITDREWLTNYKNKLHPNDEWTNVNIETYGHWIGKFNSKEKHQIIEDALKANVVRSLS